MRPSRDLSYLCASALAFALACRAAGPTDAPAQGPGSASPITDREASRAPANRSVPPEEPGKPRIRDDRGIPIPPGSAAARARTGASNPAPNDDDDAPEEPQEPAPPSPDEGEEEPQGEE